MQPKEASAAINFVLPYIWGIVDDTVNISNIDASIIENFHSLGQKRIVPKQSNEIDFNRPSGLIKAKFVYAYDASYGKLNSIFDVKNDFNITTSFDTSIINIDLGVQSNIPYRVYIKNHWIDVSVGSYLSMSTTLIRNLYLHSQHTVDIGKTLPTGQRIPANVPIRILYHNNNGVQKKISFFVEYLY